MHQEINSTVLTESAEMLKAIAHPARLNILAIIGKDRLSVTEIIDHLEIEQSLVSHHLRNMKSRGVLNVVKEGKNCFYSLKNLKLLEIVDCVTSCCSKKL
ncbi:MAG: winged helix-turn-helix transcriptional regulator [Melioribacteraceae bacterium]|nr:winged helix-turn-helix transcriptional regulator [Melioribacteraceae bacterium]